MATNTIDIVTSILTQKDLDLFCNTFNILVDLRLEFPGRNDMIKDSPVGKIERLDENRTLIRKYLEIFLSVIALSRSFVDNDIRPTFLGRDKNEMGLLDFVKSTELLKVKTGDRTLVENEVLVLTETESRVISPFSETVCLIDHTIVDELQNATGKKKRKVAFNADLPPVKKARAGALVISEPNPTTAGKTPTAMKKLGIHSGQHDVGFGSVAHITEDFTRPTSDRFVVITSSFKTTDIGAPVSPKITSPIPYVQTKAEAAATSLVNEIGPSSIPGNETGASSSALDDGSLVDDFYESQTIDSAIAHDIYVLNWDVTNNAHMDDPVMCKNFIDHVPPPGYWAYLCNRTDAEFLDRLNSAQHVCMMSELRLRDAEIATLRSKLEKAKGEVADLVVLCKRVSGLEYVRDWLKDQVLKLEIEREDLRDEIKGEAKMGEEFMSIRDTELSALQSGPLSWIRILLNLTITWILSSIPI
ncbi:hypothetical protein Tco_0949947 [Tanacetum coccineum]